MIKSRMKDLEHLKDKIRRKKAEGKVYELQAKGIEDPIVYSRLVQLCFKSRTYDEVIPKLFESYDFCSKS